MDYLDYVIKAKMGDVVSIEYLINRFQSMAIGYAYSIVHDFHKAEDASQEAFIQLFRNIHNLKEPKAFISWLRKLIFNNCYRTLQRQKFETSFSEKELTDLIDYTHQYIEGSELKALINSALLELNEGQQEVFLLYYTFNKSYKEIAVELEISESAVANRLYLGKKKLKDIMLDTMKEYLGGYVMNKESFTQKVLNNIHNLVTWNHGQNYLFNGCMQYLMECLHENQEYDYWFFSGVTGDSFTQIYKKAYDDYTNCLSQDAFDYSIAKKSFDACGYDFLYVDEVEIKENIKKWKEKIIEYINNGLPVISRGYKDIWSDFCVVCGYEDNGDKLLILTGDSESVSKCETLFDFSKCLLFVGNKITSPNLSDVYRKAVLQIPTFITMPTKNGITFGKQAFLDWAESFMDGRFQNIDITGLDSWKLHGAYLCIAGTNGASREFLKKAKELNPDMTFIDILIPIYDKQQILFDELAYSNGTGGLDYQNGGFEGGFKISPEKFKNIQKMKPISEKIKVFANYCDNILEVFKIL